MSLVRYNLNHEICNPNSQSSKYRMHITIRATIYLTWSRHLHRYPQNDIAWSDDQIKKVVQDIVELRCMEDAQGKINVNIQDTQ